MVAFVITGHNHFASGMISAVEMIMGEQKNVGIVDFLPEDDINVLDRKLMESFEKLDTTEGVIIFADLPGGSPFNRSMVMLAENPKFNIHVLSGTNLPLLVEALNARTYTSGVSQMIADLVNISSSTIVYGNKMLEDHMGKE
ncbi:PTS sugar transporter subunit IIA [Geosporobacter ferrireducens]|uniref:PTS EIIA type-4 domain-containing protein n=1 Tax=Geosporobacter ferrireducens TaxID=1424294 RepID=A0A1D8GHE3_9FIRM|nr:PTS sugar transporter subunit IIA [Geosporobacter ferrireducens]AOT70322.1 hypothetical protein Gferi_12400 [Geosporobacter ferrireducens]MTI54290.1 PTS sugar transporter subunit IIA [Geosporobacter ferrireducens]